jgi:hypothetical protein
VVVTIFLRRQPSFVKAFGGDESLLKSDVTEPMAGSVIDLEAFSLNNSRRHIPNSA